MGEYVLPSDLLVRGHLCSSGYSHFSGLAYNIILYALHRVVASFHMKQLHKISYFIHGIFYTSTIRKEWTKTERSILPLCSVCLSETQEAGKLWDGKGMIDRKENFWVWLWLYGDWRTLTMSEPWSMQSAIICQSWCSALHNCVMGNPDAMSK